MKLARSLLALAITLVVALLLWQRITASMLSARVETLEQEKARLVEYVRRLSASRRVAQVNVIDQFRDDRGYTVSRLLWQEVAPSGTIGAPLTFDITGAQGYFEALVLKFDHEHVGEGDADRGQSLVMFRRAFGDMQAPDSGAPLDRTAPAFREMVGPPEASQGPWDRFWQFVEDPLLAARYGIRVAQCEAPAVPLRRGDVWEVAVDAAGGVNLKRIGGVPKNATAGRG